MTMLASVQVLHKLCVLLGGTWASTYMLLLYVGIILRLLLLNLLRVLSYGEMSLTLVLRLEMSVKKVHGGILLLKEELLHSPSLQLEKVFQLVSVSTRSILRKWMETIIVNGQMEHFLVRRKQL